MRKLACAMVVVVILTMCCIASLGADTPGPIPQIPEQFKNIQIIKPDSSIPKDIADFSGEWEGVWKYVGPVGWGFSYGQEVRRAKLIVYEVSADKVKFLYGGGENPRSTTPGSWKNNESSIVEEGGKKSFNMMGGSGYNIQFRLEEGALKGSQSASYSVEMKRTK